MLITRIGATEEGRRCESPSFCFSHVFKHIQEELCGHMIPGLRKVWCQDKCMWLMDLETFVQFVPLGQMLS